MRGGGNKVSVRRIARRRRFSCAPWRRINNLPDERALVSARPTPDPERSEGPDLFTGSPRRSGSGPSLALRIRRGGTFTAGASSRPLLTAARRRALSLPNGAELSPDPPAAPNEANGALGKEQQSAAEERTHRGERALTGGVCS